MPTGWLITELKRYSWVKGGYAFSSDSFTSFGEPVIRIGDISQDGSINLENCKYVSHTLAKQSRSYTIRNGELLMAMTGATIGKAGFYECEFPALINQRVGLFKIVDNLMHYRFLWYTLKSYGYQEYIKLTAFGGAQPNISDVGMVGYRTTVPSLQEQSRIASFLDHETAKIDNLIEKQQQLIELLKEKRQAVISHAVTKGLNPDVPMKDSGVEWLGEVPKHWDVLRLKHLISSLESGCSVNATDIPAQQGEVAVLKTSCVYTRSFRANENKTVVSEDLHRIKCPVRKGSIIISRMNTPDLVGASALVDVDAENIYLPDRLWQTNFNPKFKLIPAYLAHFMTTQGFRTQISLGAEGASSSMQNIAKDDYLSINCLLPSIEEQQEITSFLEEKLSYFSGLELMSSEIIQLLQERRTALISAAVTGKIDVRDWVAPDTQNVEEPQEATA
ncbi:MAG: restriction endonuclease subunit S [Pantoea sp.]|nr:restriction endonuclease subunit S [Pantoea sp.]